jgi:hypothetical protein
MTVSALVGVYDADGGLLGEAAYVWGRLRGTRHCSLCDITHSPLRRKPAWDALVGDLGLPVDLLHLNELPADVAEAVRGSGAPVVLARTDAGLTVLLDAAELEQAAGSVQGFATLLRSKLDACGS